MSHTVDESRRNGSGKHFPELARLMLIAIAYLGATRIGLSIIAQPEGVASVWPPSGIAIAALILTDQKKWTRVLCVIFAANTAGNLVGGNSLPVSIGFALANISEAAFGAWALIYLCGSEITFERIFEVIVLGFTALVINGLTALLGAAVPSLAFGAEYPHTWFTWWVADGLGIVLVTPVIVSWVNGYGVSLSWLRIVEGGCLIFFVVLLSWAIYNPLKFDSNQILDIYMIFPLLIWAVLRFDQRFTTTLILIFAGINIWRIVYGVESVTGARAAWHPLLPTQLFISVITFSALILSAAISERRWSMNALQESEINYRDFVEGTNDLITRVDNKGDFTFVNRMAEKYLGLPPDKCIGLSAFDFIHSDDQQMTTEWFQQCVNQKLHEATIENRQVNASTNAHYSILWTTNFAYDEKGNFKNSKGIGRDITERKQAEKELKESESKFRNLFEQAGDYILILELPANGSSPVIVDANEAAINIHGFTRDEFIGMPIENLDAGATPNQDHERIRQLLSGEHILFETAHIRKDGTTFPVEASVKMFSSIDGPPLFISVERDITERKLSQIMLQEANVTLEQIVQERTRELEKIHTQLLHSEKLSAIGGLSASIAHEFNNPLQGVLTVLKGVDRRVLLSEEDAALVKMAINECDRMKNLIKSLQEFNRPSSGRKIPVNIHATIDSLLLLSKDDFKTRGITVETIYAEDLPKLKVVADQMKQVILNLLSNASHACSTGGKITIGTELIDKDAVKINIHDTGSGIRPNDMPRIFDPFFTTKPEKKGSGLGLSVSYGIIKRHGGKIEVQSDPGMGTTFSIILPVEGVNNAE